MARGDDSLNSDYDFLVDFEKGVALFDSGGLEADYEDLLGVRIDVVPRSRLRESSRGMLHEAHGGDLLTNNHPLATPYEPASAVRLLKL